MKKVYEIISQIRYPLKKHTQIGPKQDNTLPIRLCFFCQWKKKVTCTFFVCPFSVLRKRRRNVSFNTEGQVYRFWLGRNRLCHRISAIQCSKPTRFSSSSSNSPLFNWYGSISFFNYGKNSNRSFNLTFSIHFSFPF